MSMHRSRNPISGERFVHRSIAVPQSLDEEAKAIAQAHGWSVSSLATEAIRRYLAELRRRMETVALGEEEATP